METLAITRKIGGSLAITIPKTIVEKEGLHENQLVQLEIKKVRKCGFGMFKSLKPFTKEDKLRGQLDD